MISRKLAIALAVASALIVGPLAYAASPLYSQSLDRYAVTGPIGANWPARYAAAITPSDTAAIAIGPGSAYAIAIYVGVSGNVTVIMAGDNSNGGLGTPVTFTAQPVGYMPIQVRAVMATGTTATNIVGLAN